MSFFFYDEPIHESDRSILNNSVVDDNKSDTSDGNDYYSHPFASAYPSFFYGYPPYAYHPQPSTSAAAPTPASVPVPKPTPKANAKASAKRQSSHKQSPFDKDVYKLVDFRPNNDLFEDENNYYIQLDLPGMTKDQIHMELSEDRILKISGKRENKFKTPETKNGMKFSKMDCPYGKFSRAFNIHETADIDKIQAKMENGVLEVTIPKTEPPKTQRRVITVQ